MFNTKEQDAPCASKTLRVNILEEINNQDSVEQKSVPARTFGTFTKYAPHLLIGALMFGVGVLTLVSDGISGRRRMPLVRVEDHDHPLAPSQSDRDPVLRARAAETVQRARTMAQTLRPLKITALRQSVFTDVEDRDSSPNTHAYEMSAKKKQQQKLQHIFRNVLVHELCAKYIGQKRYCSGRGIREFYNYSQKFDASRRFDEEEVAFIEKILGPLDGVSGEELLKRDTDKDISLLSKEDLTKLREFILREAKSIPQFMGWANGGTRRYEEAMKREIFLGECAFAYEPTDVTDTRPLTEPTDRTRPTSNTKYIPNKPGVGGIAGVNILEEHFQA